MTAATAERDAAFGQIEQLQTDHALSAATAKEALRGLEGEVAELKAALSESADLPRLEQLLVQTSAMSLKELRLQAAQLEVDEAAIEEARDSDEPKAALMALLIDKQIFIGPRQQE